MLTVMYREGEIFQLHSTQRLKSSVVRVRVNCVFGSFPVQETLIVIHSRHECISNHFVFYDFALLSDCNDIREHKI